MVAGHITIMHNCRANVFFFKMLFTSASLAIALAGCGGTSDEPEAAAVAPVAAAPVAAPITTVIPTSAPAQTHTITLRVTGETSFSHSRGTLVGEKEDPRGSVVSPPGIAYIKTKGDPQISAELSQRLPWSHTFSVSDAYLEVSASNDAPWSLSEEAKYGVSSAGIINVEILVDGQVVTSDKTRNERGTAACHYTVGKDPSAAPNTEAFSNDAKDRRIAELESKILFQRTQRQAIVANADRDALTPSDLKFRLDDKDRVIANYQEELVKLQSSR